VLRQRSEQHTPQQPLRSRTLSEQPHYSIWLVMCLAPREALVRPASGAVPTSAVVLPQQHVNSKPQNDWEEPQIWQDAGDGHAGCSRTMCSRGVHRSAST